MSAQEWVLLASAVVPVLGAAGVYYFGLRSAKRHDEQHPQD